MHRALEYTFFFVVMILLQLFLFNNLNVSVYINALVYIAFIILLPMETPSIVVLLLGLLLGVSMDFVMGTAGINTSATLLTSFMRSFILDLTVGKEEVRDGGVPGPARIGHVNFIKYASAVILLQCIVFFTLESLRFDMYYLTLLRILLSAVFTLVLVYFVQMLLPGAAGKKSKF